MQCPKCLNNDGFKVADSRATIVMGRETIRRRRECKSCGWRFTTIEVTYDEDQRRRDLSLQKRRLADQVREFLAYLDKQQ